VPFLHVERLSASSSGTPARFFSVVLSRTFPFCPLLPRIAPYCPILPRTAPYCHICPLLSRAVGIHVDDVNGGKGGGGATRARTWTSGGGYVVVEAGGGGASAESVDGGAVSAVSIGSARCLIGVCLPRLQPRCAGRAHEWGGVQTCFFALWGPSLTCCDVFAVYSCLCCRLSVCFLSCASPAYGGRLVYFFMCPTWTGGARRGGRDAREGQGAVGEQSDGSIRPIRPLPCPTRSLSPGRRESAM